MNRGRGCRGRRDRIGHHSRRAELGGYAADEVTMFSLNVSPDGVVSGKRSRAVGTGDADALMSLANVSAQVSLVAVGSLAEGALQLGAGAADGVAGIGGGVAHGHGEAHVVASCQSGR